jgi:hypothetical protein
VPMIRSLALAHAPQPMPGPQPGFAARSDGGGAAVPGDLELPVDGAQGDGENLGNQRAVEYHRYQIDRYDGRGGSSNAPFP